MLYLPEENHFGGSSEPAWVASSWELTPPTQSSPPPLVWLASPPLSPRGTLLPRGWILPLSKAPRMLARSRASPIPGLLQPGSGVRGQPQTLWRSQMWRQRKKSAVLDWYKCLVCLLYLSRPCWCWWKRGLQSSGKYCCCLFTPVQNEKRPSKVAELPSWPVTSPLLIGGELKSGA